MTLSEYQGICKTSQATVKTSSYRGIHEIPKAISY
jgi:hypothetical protein